MLLPLLLLPLLSPGPALGLLPPVPSSSSSKGSVGGGGGPRPIDPAGWPQRFPAKEHCSRCGLCETALVSRVSDACAFLGPGMGRIDALEAEVHGRGRDGTDLAWGGGDRAAVPHAEEGRFGVLHRPVALARGTEREAQWTGVVTGIAAAVLEAGMVDAVVCVAAGDGDGDGDGDGADGGGDWSSPEPILARTVAEVMRGRGVKPSLAPSLRVLDEVRADPAVRRLLFCGVGCAVQALRSVEADLDLDELYVLGTNCADNSPTPEAARNFLRDGAGIGDVGGVRGYEFMQDFRVHVKEEGGGYTKLPYFSLPGTIAEASIAPSCLACFDYVNALADVVVGYMGAPLAPGGRMDRSSQTLTVRNGRGARMVDAAIRAGRVTVVAERAGGSGSHEALASATVAKDAAVMAITGGDIPERGMPRPLGELMATVLGGIGPKGIAFARYSLDYHVLRNHLHTLHEWGEDRARSAMPDYARSIVDRYVREDAQFQAVREAVLAKGRKKREGRP